MSDEKPEWKPDRAVTLAALAAIDHQQRNAPKCRFCGQRCNVLDAYGLCSKTGKAHQEWRAGVRADRKASVR
ncbi:hypothetical protein ACTJI8_12930 [Microbacterium sp. 22303]|uniref:hypothetical protein n=1 Tax=Microbacterium sp. 22303 TaxID=3453905 RepID=UPI003F856438